jgi:nitroreductase
VDFFEVIRNRRTTNGPFRRDPVTVEHQRLLVTVAGMAPSHFNSQPWRFVLIDAPETISAVADISRDSMRTLLEEGTFWQRYRPYFRFTAEEMETRRDGIYFDQLPALLKPFTKHIFSGTGQAIMNRFNVPRTLAEDNRKLVAESPLLLAVMLDKKEYRPGELSGFYSVFGIGAAIENIWLATVALGMGIQFISTPMEIPANWQKIHSLLHVPEELELMAIYRLGYLPENTKRPTIDWSSRQRKTIPQYVFRNDCRTPEPDGELPAV